MDKRTDIWALGCVLYELLTGKHAFEGEDVPEILAAVMKGEPDWSALPATTPPNVSFVLRRCLEKDAKRRLRDAADLQIQMEETQVTSATTVPAAASTVPARTGWRRAIPLVLTAVVAVIITGSAVWNLMRNEPPTLPSRKRFVITLPETDRIIPAGIALSPDGKTLVYIGVRDGVRQLYRRSMDQLEAVPIPGTEDAGYPFFSPDGQWVGFFTSAQLKKVSLAGGPATTLCDITAGRRGASWGRDDTIVFSTGTGLLRVSAAGGAPQPVTNSEGADQGGHDWMDILPGERAVLFTVWSGSLPAARIAALDLATGQQRILLEGTHPRFISTGHIVFARPNSLWAVPFDPERLELTGSPVPIWKTSG